MRSDSCLLVFHLGSISPIVVSDRLSVNRLQLINDRARRELGAGAPSDLFTIPRPSQHPVQPFGQGVNITDWNHHAVGIVNEFLRSAASRRQDRQARCEGLGTSDAESLSMGSQSKGVSPGELLSDAVTRLGAQHDDAGIISGNDLQLAPLRSISDDSQLNLGQTR